VIKTISRITLNTVLKIVKLMYQVNTRTS